MKEFFTNLWTLVVQNHVLNIVWALVIFVIGFLISVFVSKKINSFLKNRIASHNFKLLPAGASTHADKIADTTGKLVFYLLLIFTLLFCLTALNLSQAAEPIQNFMNQLTEYSTNILGAGLLLLMAWITAIVLRAFSIKAFDVFKVDEKLKYQTKDGEEPKKLSGMVGEVVYWVTFLLFITPILRALKIDGITRPLEQMLTKILEYVPNLVVAALVLVGGLFIAKIARRSVAGLLFLARLDEIGEKAGAQNVFGAKSLSRLIGVVAYVLVAIPAIVIALDALKIEPLSNAVGGFFNKILNATGDVIGAGLLLLVLFIVGGLVSGMVSSLLEGFGFDKFMFKLGFLGRDGDKVGGKVSAAAGKLCFIALMFMGVIIACDMLGFESLAGLVTQFAVFGGHIILGVVVLILGVFLSNLAADMIRSRGVYSDAIALLARIVILVFTGAVAVQHMDIGGHVVTTAFALLLGAVCVAIALAFGLGGRDFAAKKLENWDKKFNSSNKES
jgi:hypothetical protein